MKRLRIVTSLTAVLLVPALLLAACGGTGSGNDDGQNTQETADEQEISEDSVGEAETTTGRIRRKRLMSRRYPKTASVRKPGRIQPG